MRWVDWRFREPNVAYSVGVTIVYSKYRKGNSISARTQQRCFAHNTQDSVCVCVCVKNPDFGLCSWCSWRSTTRKSVVAIGCSNIPVFSGCPMGCDSFHPFGERRDSPTELSELTAHKNFINHYALQKTVLQPHAKIANPGGRVSSKPTPFRETRMCAKTNGRHTGAHVRAPPAH